MSTGGVSGGGLGSVTRRVIFYAGTADTARVNAAKRPTDVLVDMTGQNGGADSSITPTVGLYLDSYSINIATSITDAGGQVTLDYVISHYPSDFGVSLGGTAQGTISGLGSQVEGVYPSKPRGDGIEAILVTFTSGTPLLTGIVVVTLTLLPVQ